MSFLNEIRNSVRRLHLVRTIDPCARLVESLMLRRIGSYNCEIMHEGQTRLSTAHGDALLIGPPRQFANLARSAHERPVLTALLNAFAPLAREGVAWDIGANAGFYSLILSRLVGSRGTVYAFEPVPPTCESLRSNLSTAAVGNAALQMVALSDFDGFADMRYCLEENTTSSLVPSSGPETLRVAVARGDTLVKHGTCSPPNLIKLDVEGHELRVLEGMRGVLSRADCKALVCEVHFSILERIGEHNAAARLGQLLDDAGFKNRRWISRSHLLALKRA